MVKSIADEEYEKELIGNSIFKYKEEEHEIVDYFASPDLQKVILKPMSLVFGDILQ